MKHIRLFIVAACLFALAAPVFAAASASGESPIQVNNNLRLGYDDNIYLEPARTDPESSVRVIEELELLVNLNMERMYLGLRYLPSLLWYSNRDAEDPDNKDYDFLNDLDLNFTYDFNPALSLSFNDTLRSSKLPQINDENYVVRRDDDNLYNSAIATLSYNLRPETRLDLSGRHILLDYADDNSALYGNYYSVVGGLTLRQQLASRTTLMGDLRYQTISYNKAPADHTRDANSVFAGLGAEQNFNPKLVGSLRAGMENRAYDAENYDDNTQPYGELSVTFLPSPATRITGAASYSIYESDVDAYLSQNRSYLSLSVAHDFTAKLSFYVSGAYSLSAYEADYSLDNAMGDADENAYMVSARLAYRINRINWLEAGWQYVQLDSDVLNRESYVRNRFDVGWKIQLF